MFSTDPIRPTSIQARTLEPDYAAQALEAITLISYAPDPPQLLDAVFRATATLGASGSIYTAAIPEDGDEPSCFGLFACHPKLVQTQDSKVLLVDHPWFRFAQTHTMPGTDHQIVSRHESDMAALQLASQHGFRSCLVIPISNGTRSTRSEMLCIGSDMVDAFEGPEARAVRALARALAAELHDWMTRHLSQRLRHAAQIEAGDIELLTLEWQGLGTKEIAARMGLSVPCVDSRFQRLNLRLRCTNRKRSAERAAAYGLFEPV